MNQSYLFPYIGYFQLIAYVDKYVIYDDAQYIKQGWVNRNRFPDKLFTFRLRKHSADTKINECYFFDIEEDKIKFKRRTGLKRADKYLDLLRQEDNLAVNITRTIKAICNDLNIKTPLYLSSEFSHGKFVQGILDITRALGGKTYVNPPGGKTLYNQGQFEDIKLEFIETTPGPSILWELEKERALPLP